MNPIFIRLVENARAAMDRARQRLSNWPSPLEQIAARGGWEARLVLASAPLWLTPETFGRLDRLRRRGAIIGNLAAASTLWIFASQPLLAPILPRLEATIDQVGRAMPYWDPNWAPWWAQSALFIGALLIFLSTTTLQWLMVQVAGGLSRLVGDGRVRPPPFAYFALMTSGAFAGLAIAFALMTFAAKPVNAPVWAWLSRPDSSYLALALGLLVIGLVVRRDQVTRERDLQIYGGGLRAFAYQISSLFLTLGPLIAAAFALLPDRPA